MFLLVILLSGFLIFIIYSIFNSFRQTSEYFRKNSILHLKCMSILGNSLGLFMRQYRLTDFVTLIYNKFPSERIFGMYAVTKPILVIRDVDLLKKICVKDFQYFTDRTALVGEIHDNIFSNTVLVLKGQKWKSMRTTLNPLFSTSKMKQMFNLMIDCSEHMIVYLNARTKNVESINVNVSDIFYRYTNDVITSCIFDIKINSFELKKNQFFMMGMNFITFGQSLVVLKQLFMTLLPSVMTFLKFELVDHKAKDFYTSIIERMIINRQYQSNSQSSNMLSLLTPTTDDKFMYHMNEKNYGQNSPIEPNEISSNCIKKHKWNLNEITAQYFVFYTGGFESSGTLMSFTTYELALNEDVQNRLYNEIKWTHESLMGNKLTYEIIQKMSYLDMVISETLRKWPSFPLIDRKCVKDYKLIDNAGREMTISKDTVIWLPIYAIHHDEKFYSNPEKFDPERFSISNRDKITNNNSYLPFGVGPRNCIGYRFALLETKITLYYLLLNFQLIVSNETPMPIKIKSTPIALSIDKAIYLKLKPRNLQ